MERRIQETHSAAADETQIVKRLDGEVTRLEEIAFAGGEHCEVWVGEWRKGGSGEVSGRKVDVEKVSPSTIVSILLMQPRRLP